jgi:hypothetical protein
MSRSNSVRASFRTCAVIDWIELTLTLENGTQFRYIQEKLRMILNIETRPHVRPLNPGAGNVATRFVIRIHETHAQTLDNLQKIMTALETAHPFARAPEVTGIELALDFYSRYDPEAVTELVHRLQARIAARGNPRQYDPNKSTLPKNCNRYLNPDRPEPVTGLVIDPSLNLRLGNKVDEIQWQIYDKRTDNNRRLLDPGQRRARAEFTLRGKQLAQRVLGPDAEFRLATLNDLRAFKFETLAGLLHFRKFKNFEITDYVRVVAVTLSKLVPWREQGITNYTLATTVFYQDKRRPNLLGRPAKRKYSRHTVADAELNDIVRRKFKALSGRFA